MRFIGLFLSLLFVNLVCAELRFAGIFGDNSILQQNCKIPVWGTAAPNVLVVVEYNKKIRKCKADEEGKWEVVFPPMKADGLPHKLILKSQSEKVVCENVKLGEVWMASGQSNMEYTIGAGVTNQEQTIKDANFPDIRFLTVKTEPTASVLTDVDSKEWVICSSTNVKSFSAVSYYFAKELYLSKKVPVGIIVAARGATRIESWISNEMLSKSILFKEKLQEITPEKWNLKKTKSIADNRLRDSIANYSFNGIQKGVLNIDYDDSKWNKVRFPYDISDMKYKGFWGIIWHRRMFDVQNLNTECNWKLNFSIRDNGSIIYLNGKEIWKKNVVGPQKLSINIPGKLFNKQGNVLVVRMNTNWDLGYMGENSGKNCYLISDKGDTLDISDDWKCSNQMEPHAPPYSTYATDPTVNYNSKIAPLIPYAIKGFLWYQGEGNTAFPNQYSETMQMLIEDWRERWNMGNIPFLYVQLANYLATSSIPKNVDNWAILRDEQTKTLKMVPNTAMASAIDIGEWNNVHPRNKEDVGKRLFIAADNVGYGNNRIANGPMLNYIEKQEGKLVVNYLNADNGLTTKDGNRVKGFATADEKGVWKWVDAIIDGNKIIINTAGVANPVAVQYAWQSNPETNLYNIEGLPAIPFNTKINP